MNKLIRVAFQFVSPIVDLLACPAIAATASLPRMRQAGVTDIPLFVREFGANRVFPVRPLAAIDAPAGEQGGQFRNGDTGRSAFDSRVFSFDVDALCS